MYYSRTVNSFHHVTRSPDLHLYISTFYVTSTYHPTSTTIHPPPSIHHHPSTTIYLLPSIHPIPKPSSNQPPEPNECKTSTCIPSSGPSSVPTPLAPLPPCAFGSRCAFGAIHHHLVFHYTYLSTCASVTYATDPESWGPTHSTMCPVLPNSHPCM
jgi:hypothetical protein